MNTAYKTYKAYKQSINDIYKELNTSKNGLSHNQVTELERIYGKNILIEKTKKLNYKYF